MKIESGNEVVLGNAGPSTAFTIGCSSKAFQILSSGIYKNKIRAVVREVTCNAVDAHLLSHTAKKWIVKAPSELDPRFIVTDFGPGLSEQMMLEIYTQYFASTKTGNEIGGFGLGAKSPFSYTDTFSVESRHCGIVKSYTAMIVNGVPEMVKTFEGQMSDHECHGITVTVPVKLDDIHAWHSEIKYVLRPFDPNVYKIEGADINVQSFHNYENYNNDWFGASNAFSDCIYAIYGNIVYPIGKTPGLSADWLMANNSDTYIHFPMNSLMPQPSREELQDDEVTVKNIVDRVKAINDAEFEKDMIRLRSIKYERELIRNLKQLSSGQYRILENTHEKFMGKTINELFGGRDYSKMAELLKRSRTYYVHSEYPSLMSVVDSKGYYRRRRVSEMPTASLFNHNILELNVLIDDTESKHLRPTLKGLAIKAGKNSWPIIVLRDHPHEMATLDKIIEVMAGDKVIVQRMSELDDVRKLVPGFGEKRQRSNSTRPKAPNAILHKFDSNKGYYIATELFMTNDEITNYSGAVLGIFGHGEVKALSTNFGDVTGVTWQYIRDFIKDRTGTTELLLVRPVIYKRMLKNDKVVCAAKMAADALIKLSNETSADMYVHMGTSGYFKTNLDRYTQLRPLYKLFGAERTPESDARMNTLSSLRHMTINDADDELSEVRQTIAENIKASSELFDSRLKEFEKEYPVEYCVMINMYALRGPVIDGLLQNIKV